MKKIFVVLLSLLLFAGCSSEKLDIDNRPAIDEPAEEIIIEEHPAEMDTTMDGGWSINTDLSELDDEVFDNACQNETDVIFSPIVLLGRQPSVNENLMYLAYSKKTSSDTNPTLKVVTIYNDLQNPGNAIITNVSDFDLLNYLNGFGQNTPEGLMGGWQDNDEQPNLLSNHEQEIFDNALSKLIGMAYVPIATLGSQVIAGANYAFLAITTEDYDIRHLYVIKVTTDLQGNAKITNECGIDLSSFN